MLYRSGQSTTFVFIVLINSMIGQKANIENPAYVTLAPCPCDLTFDACDINCCCDSECSAQEENIFNECLSGVFGGELPRVSTHWCNQSGEIGAPDWSPLLCTISETNSHLGLFFSVLELVTSDGSYPDLELADDYQLVQVPESVPSTSDTGYKKGYPIESEAGYLSLPDQTSIGHCIQSPVMYLEKKSSSCTEHLTAESCQSPSSRLNINNYILCNSTVPCTNNLQVFRQYGIDASTVDVETLFLCTSDLTGYVPQLSDVETQTPGFLLDNNVRRTLTSPTVTNCSWSSGSNLPPAPSLSQQVCQNVVIDVSYNVVYVGTSISRIEATYLLADVPLETVYSYNYNKQYYSSGTSLSPSVTEMVTVNVVKDTVLTAFYSTEFTPSSGSTSIKYSGRPGYNLETALNMLSHTQAYYQPNIPRADVTGLCELSTDDLITFPRNQMSQCYLEIPNSLIDNCTRLQTLVYQKLEQLYPVVEPNQTISRFGSYKISESSHWIPVLRDILDYDSPTNAAAATPNTNSNLSTQATADIDIEQACTSIPATAHFQLMYALTGRSGNVPIYQIVGAQIKVKDAAWSPSCTSSGCDSSTVSRFPLTFSTEYIEVPVQTPEPVLRYDRMRQENCIRCDPPWEFDSFFYPIGNNIPRQFKEENLASFLLVLASFIVMWIVSQSWWRDHFII